MDEKDITIRFADDLFNSKYDFETNVSVTFGREEYTFKELLKIFDEDFERLRKRIDDRSERSDTPLYPMLIILFDNIALRRRIEKLSTQAVENGSKPI